MGLSRPIFVVGPPRAGAGLLAAALSRTDGCWSAVDELGELLAGAENSWAKLAARGHGSTGRLFDAAPRNALQVSFLHDTFDDAQFVYVHRDPAAALAESLALWRSGDAVTHPQLPGWSGPPWSFPLVPGWENLEGRELAEVVVEQWVRIVGPLLDDLEALPAATWCLTECEVLRADPAGELERLFGFLGLPWDPARSGAPFADPPTLRPEAEAALLAELEPFLPRTAALAARAADWIAV